MRIYHFNEAKVFLLVNFINNNYPFLSRCLINKQTSALIFLFNLISDELTAAGLVALIYLLLIVVKFWLYFKIPSIFKILLLLFRVHPRGFQNFDKLIICRLDQKAKGPPFGFCTIAVFPPPKSHFECDRHPFGRDIVKKIKNMFSF